MGHTTRKHGHGQNAARFPVSLLLFLLALFPGLLIWCPHVYFPGSLAWSQSVNPQQRDGEQPQLGTSEVVATINGKPIHAAELNHPLRLQLYDLERAGYELRVQYLRQLIIRRVLGADSVGDESAWQAALAQAEVHIQLEPPLPPRLDVTSGDNAVRGSAEAPITLIAFADLQSPHYRRVQPILHRLLAGYQGLVRLVVRDLPQPFHPQARQAAAAAACAREQDAYWSYHDLLLQNQDDFTTPALVRYAATLGLHLERFQVCLSRQPPRAVIDDDVATARQLGVHTVPTFFINGLYLKSPRTYAEVAWLIEREMVRLGLPAPGVAWHEARLSTLPLVLLGTVVQQEASQSVALIHHTETATTQRFKQGAEVLPGVVLVRIEPRRVYVQRDERFEFLPLIVQAVVAGSPEPAPSLAVEPDTVMTLSQAEVEQALHERDALAKQLTTGQLDLEGKRLLKLTRVEPGSFYARLGLRPRDVLMQVNGQWVHDQHNPLWEALQTQHVVTLTIMRQGLPRTYQYTLEKTATSP